MAAQVEVPLGRREGQRLEFKSAAALKKPLGISRGVVAMLNAGGGELWIGLREENGYAVEVEDVPDLERAREDLLNHLIEVVEPRLQPGDVVPVPVEHEGRRLLLLKVGNPEDRRPFAQMKEGGRHFVMRVDHRIRPMTREEILGARDPHEPRTRLPELRSEVLKRNKSGLWVGVEPQPHVQLNEQAKRIEELLLDPSASGNRADGRSFRYPPFLGIKPVPAAGRVEFGRDDYRKTTIWDDGCIEFWTTMSGLHHRTDSVKEIYPLALLEYPISVLRLAAQVFSESPSKPDRGVLVDTVLMGAEGWHLPAYPPDTYGYVFRHADPEGIEGGQFMLPSPLAVPWQEFSKHPDHTGYMLVRAIYQAFHLPEDRIPAAYDRAARRLMLKD